MFWNRLWSEVSRHFAPERLVGYGGKLLQMVLIVGFSALFAWLIGKALKRTVERKSGLARKPSAKTVFTIMQSAVYYVFFFIALVMVLRVLGVDFTAILAGAGVVGLALGFGAQKLVRDFLAGFFLIFEDSMNVGDVVTVGDVAGTVESIGIRRTVVRALDGTLYTVPNGELGIFGNKNRDYMRAIVTVELAYEQDAEAGMAVAREVADAWYEQHQDLALARPEVQGLLNFGESGMSIRVMAQVKPMQHWAAERDLRVALKKAYDERDVDIPFARRVVYLKNETGTG